MKTDFIYLFLERGEGREKERERNINVWLSVMHPLVATWPKTLACALIGNWTRDPLVLRPALNLLSHTSQGLFIIFKLNLLRWHCSQSHASFKCTPQQSTTCTLHLCPLPRAKSLSVPIYHPLPTSTYLQPAFALKITACCPCLCI